MWKIKLENFEICNNFSHVCQNYQHLFGVDLIHGKYSVDGCSLVGIMSLMFHTVDIHFSKKVDKEIIDDFTNKIKDIGAYYED